VPLQNGESITGYVDLVSERTYEYKQGNPSALIKLPEEFEDVKEEARQEMLESLADFDDALLEQLLEDAVPSTDEIYQQLTQNLRRDKIVPVFVGSGLFDHGVRRLLKALRHEAPSVELTAKRKGIDGGDGLLLQVFKTYHQPHAGKLSVARVWRGSIADNTQLGGERVGGIFSLLGHEQTKLNSAQAGEVVALGRMDSVQTGQALTDEGPADGAAGDWPAPPQPVYARAIHAANRNDEVKLSGAVTRVVEEDPSLIIEHDADAREMRLCGQGEVHLNVAIQRLLNKYKLEVTTYTPQVPYKETIRKPVKQHARHKKQSGGHGEFGDVHLEIKPLPRGGDFEFSNSIVGGSVPKQYIPAVETGVREYLHEGPLGFPVVDVGVNLYDGQYHSVDSSDMAFRRAAILAMKEGMKECQPVLLEPICKVTITVPSEATARAQQTISRRRGQILGFDVKQGWKGWDEVQALMPQTELHDLIVELRSLSQGVGTYSWEFDHLQELTGRLADDIVARQHDGKEAAQ
jgi:elongation factor G